MISETETQHFHGVRCLHCSQPIPVSPLIAGMRAELVSAEPAAARHQKCQVFHVRCVSCGKEKPYKVSEIREFPRLFAEVPRSAPSAARSPELDGNSKAANA